MYSRGLVYNSLFLRAAVLLFVRVHVSDDKGLALLNIELKSSETFFLTEKIMPDYKYLPGAQYHLRQGSCQFALRSAQVHYLQY